MSISRYNYSGKVTKSTTFVGWSSAMTNIRAEILQGTLPYTEIVLNGSQRLDTIAGKYYGDGSLWWVIAAASNIGWGLQIPAGTLIYVPDPVALTRVLS